MKNFWGVSIQDYMNGQADNSALFDVANLSQQDLTELNKALEAGSLTGRDVADSTTASGAPLKVESLEANLKYLTFTQDYIKLWKAIPKMAARNTVEEFNQLSSYGADRGGFNNEGELPEEEDSTYVRRSELVKFVGTTRSITHPMQLVTTMSGDVVNLEIQNGTMWILRKVNRSLAFGDANIIPQEWNGLYAQQQGSDVWASLDAYQDSESVIDLRGAPLQQDDIENGALGIYNNFGMPTDFYAPPQVMTDFTIDYFSKQRILLGGQGGGFDGKVGYAPKVVSTTIRDINLNHDTFLKAPEGRLLSASATHSKAPNKPTSGGAGAVTADTQNRFTDHTGQYYYGVAAINRYGTSQIEAIGAGTVNVTAGNSVDLTFSDGGGAYPATGYVIYRSAKNPAGTFGATTLYPIFTVSTAQRTAGYDGTTAGKVRDRNRFIQNTEQGFMLEATPNVWMFKQLAPLMKMDLAVLAPAYRFMLLLYGTPQLYAPKKMVRYINIGRA